MKKKRFLSVFGLVAALVMILVGGVRASDPGEPQPGTVRGLSGPHTFYAAASGITTTTYTDSPKNIYGQDVSLMWLYHSADIFVTADVSGTDVITVTPQFFPDASNWADATYTYVANTLASTTSVITSTGLTTATTTTSSSSTPTEATHRVVMSADGTDYLRIPLAGKYVRFKIETSGTVTPTIKALFRND
jgi:hypothetical protein